MPTKFLIYCNNYPPQKYPKCSIHQGGKSPLTLIEFISTVIRDPKFSLVLGLIGFLIGNRLAIGQDQRQEFNRAAAKFREVFSPILNALTPPYSPLPEDLGTFLWRHSPDSKSAVLEFSNFLKPIKAKNAFLQTWDEYYCKDNKPNFAQYSCRELPEEEQRKIKEFALSRIEKILKFAKPK